MLTSLTYEEIIKIIRKELITQSELKSNMVLNSDSEQGTDLVKDISSDEETSIDSSDLFILFELLEDTNGFNAGTEEENGNLSSIVAYKFSLHLYGNGCHTLAQKILSRFKSEAVANKLQYEGIHLLGFDTPEPIKEFINNTLWQRCDMSINFEVRYEITQIEKKEYIASEQKIHLKVSDIN